MVSDYERLFGSGSFSLEEETPTIESGTEQVHDPHALVHISDPKAWANYSDPILYQLDKRMREWLEEMCQDKAWVGTSRKATNSRRYTFATLWAILFNREYDQKKDSKWVVKASRVFKYYSSKVQKGGWDPHSNKQKSKTIYTISPARFKKNPPYSLKLRVEWLAAQGADPNGWNMKTPKDDLAPGHARNPRTDANMEARRAEGRRRFNEYQRNRRAKKASDES